MRSKILATGLLCATAALLAGACADDDKAGSCASGANGTCHCASGALGVRTCQARAWGACDCSGARPDASAGASGSSGQGGAGAAAGTGATAGAAPGGSSGQGGAGAAAGTGATAGAGGTGSQGGGGGAPGGAGGSAGTGAGGSGGATGGSGGANGGSGGGAACAAFSGRRAPAEFGGTCGMPAAPCTYIQVGCDVTSDCGCTGSSVGDTVSLWCPSDGGSVLCTFVDPDVGGDLIPGSCSGCTVYLARR